MNLGLIPTLFLFFGVLSLIYGGALYQYRNVRYQKAIENWSLGALMLGTATLLTLFRAQIPTVVSYFFANALAFLAYAELNRALKRLALDDHSSRNNRGRDAVVLVAYTVLLLAIDAWAAPEYREAVKTSFVSLAVVVLSIEGARHCYEASRRHGIPLAAVCGHIFVFVALLWFLRIVAAAAKLGQYAFDATPVNTVVFVLIFITGVLRYLIFPLVLLQKIENDKQAQLKQTLVKASKSATAGALSASIAHELNQPLAATRINAQVLRKALENGTERPGDGQAGRMLDLVNDILEENERAARIITSLRGIFSQSQATRTEVDIAQLIEKVVALVQKDLERHQIELEFALASGLRVAIAEDEFQQVILNLLLNSIHALQEHASDTGRTIAIATRCDVSQVEITVADNGPGVPPEMEQTLFEILSTSKDTGMGVGLWLSKYIVERQGGTIAYSRSDQGGACFTIQLPRPQA
jgi:signal transduction histidine kinase